MDKNKIIQAATKYVQKGQFDKAIKEYQRIIEDDPRDIRVLLKIGELHQKRGDNAEAAATLLRVAEAYSNDGFFLKAAAVYKQVLKLNPALLDVNLRLAELYQQLGLMSDAMQQYQLVANSYEKQGNARASLNLIKKLVELEPDNAASRVRLAEAYSNEGMTAEAIAELSRVADQLKQSARNDEFVRVAERLLFLDPTNLPLSRELANIYLGKGDTKRALSKLQVCFKADPQDIDTLILLAQTFLDLGQQAKTVSVYKELAKIYAERGREEEELATWRRVLTLVPDDPDALAATGQGESEDFVEEDVEPEPPPRPAPRPAARSVSEGVAPAPRAMSTAVDRPGVAPRGDPRAADVQKLLAETDVYLKYGLHEKAADHLRRILTAAPRSLPAHQKAKELYLLTGDSTAAADELVVCARLSLDDGNQPQAKVFLEQARELAPSHPAIAELSELMGEVTDLPELGADEAILVEPMAEDAELVAPDATFEDAQELLVDEPSLGADFAGDEALLVADDSVPALGGGFGDEALLVAGDEPLGRDVAGALADEPLVDESSEMSNAVLSAAGIAPEADPEPELELDGGLEGFLASPRERPAVTANRKGEGDVTDAFVVPNEVRELGHAARESTTARVRQPSRPPSAPPLPEPPRRSGSSGISPMGPAASPLSRPPLAVSAPPAAVAPAAAPIPTANAPLRTPSVAPSPAAAAPPAPKPSSISAPLSRPTPLSAMPAPSPVTRAPSPAARAPSAPPRVIAPPAPVVAAPPPPEEDPPELAEVEFFLEQGLLDEADEPLATLRTLAQANPRLGAKIEALAARLAELRQPPEASQPHDFHDFSAELEQEIESAVASVPQEDFQYPVEDVISEFKKGLERVLGPQEVEAHYEMGIAFREMGLIDEAIAEFDVAQRGAGGTPREADCFAMLGICNAAKGEFGKATAAFEGALRSKSLKPEGRLNLYFEIGTAREADGDILGALDAYEKVAKVDPGYREVGASLTRVRAAKAGLNGHAAARPVATDGVIDSDGATDDDPEPTLGGEPSRARKIGYV